MAVKAFFVLLIVLIVVHHSPGQEDPQQNYCSDGPSSFRVSGVGVDENNEKVVVGSNSLISYISSIESDSLIVLGSRKPNPVVEATDVKQLELRISDKTLIFDPQAAFFRIKAETTNGKSVYFGGWNQVLLGCPQPLCIDARLDAATIHDSSLLVFRGSYFWSINLNIEDEVVPPTVKTALKIEDHFPTLNGPLTAVAVDTLGTIYFLDYFEQLHIYTKNLSAFYDIALPPSVASKMDTESITRLFQMEPFLIKQLQPSQYWVLKGIDAKHVWPDTKGDFFPEAAFVVPQTESSPETLLVLAGIRYLKLSLSSAIRVTVANVMMEQEAYKGSDIFNNLKDYLDNVDSDSDGPKSINKLHSDFPNNVHSAFTYGSNTFLNHGWSFYQVETLKFAGNNRLDEDSFTVIGNIMDSVLRCKEKDYPSWGFKSYKGFLNKYKPLLIPEVEVDIDSPVTTHQTTTTSTSTTTTTSTSTTTTTPTTTEETEKVVQGRNLVVSEAESEEPPSSSIPPTSVKRRRSKKTSTSTLATDDQEEEEERVQTRTKTRKRIPNRGQKKMVGRMKGRNSDKVQAKSASQSNAILAVTLILVLMRLLMI